MTQSVRLDRFVYMFLVGQTSDSDGEPILFDDKRPITFSSADIWVRCGFTQSGLLSMGHNGYEKRIRINSHRIHSSKDSVHRELSNRTLGISDMYDVNDIFAKVFTDAVINNIFRRMNIWRAWAHIDFSVRVLPDTLVNLHDQINVIDLVDNDVNPYKSTADTDTEFKALY